MLIKRGYFVILLLLVMPLVVADAGYFYFNNAAGQRCYDSPPIMPGANKLNIFPFPCLAGCFGVEGQTYVYYCTDLGSCAPAWVAAYYVNWDGDQRSCECYGKTWFTDSSKYFLGLNPNCCGDDTSPPEYYMTRGIGAPACMRCPVAFSSTSCVSNSLNCRNEYSTEVTCYDNLDNDCDGLTDCKDTANCVSGTETNCRNGINDDCDSFTDCSDTDCSLSLACIGCSSENDATKCSDGVDNDCDSYIDCASGNADSDCISAGLCTSCVAEVCADGRDNDCDGKSDCVDGDCFEQAVCKNRNCMAENTVSLCTDGQDNDCDGFKDYMDRDCQGCPKGKRLCSDGTCSATCSAPQGCVGAANGNCEEGEGCACSDCLNKRDSCERELICDPNTIMCSCPAGTSICSDDKCRSTCSICGNLILEQGEECDGTDFGEESGTCPTECAGIVTCTEDCMIDASGCECPPCDPERIDGYCCAYPEDGLCDVECTGNVDPDCPVCTPFINDCCDDSAGNGCDYDCIAYKDPDCGTSCSNEKDGCCNADSGDGCDMECDEGIDPDCPAECSNSEGDCCNNEIDGVCDPDCILGVDFDCKCGNKILNDNETCDYSNLDGKTCTTIFGAEYGGILECFGIEDENPCHFDTSGCYKTSTEICTGGDCSPEKDCRCPECVGEQDGCSFGSICDSTSKCACDDGTTLCSDGTCSATCSAPQGCIGAANGNCEEGEGCTCSDCEGEKGPCSQTSICKDGICTGCSLSEAYWADVHSEEKEDCIGSDNDIKMIVEGTPGCKGKSVSFQLKEDGIPLGNAIFEKKRAEFVWSATIDPAEEEVSYSFEANLEGSADKIESEKLDVRKCLNECDADCDGFCETQDCVEQHSDYCKNTEDEEGNFVLDLNPLSPWCEDCGPYGLSSKQNTCASYYDCTPGWWGNTPPADWSGKINPTEAMNYLEWGECGESKGATDPNRVSGENMRNRLVCPPNLPQNQCCINQASCYCKLPVASLKCDLPEFRPTEVKGCLAEEKFPFFTNTNILFVILILTGFYLWKTRIKKNNS